MKTNYKWLTGLMAAVLMISILVAPGKNVLADAPANPEPTAAEVAAGIQSIPPVPANATILTLPSVPEGFTIAVKSSDRPDVIPLDAQVFPLDKDTPVTWCCR